MSTPANLTQLITDLQTLIALQADIQPLSVQMLAHAQQAAATGGGGGGGLTEAELIDALDTSSTRMAAFQSALGSTADVLVDIPTLLATPSTVADIVALLKTIVLTLASTNPTDGTGGSSDGPIRDALATANFQTFDILRKTKVYGDSSQSTIPESIVAWENFVGSTYNSTFWATYANVSTGGYTQSNSILNLTSGTGATGSVAFASAPIFQPRGDKLILRLCFTPGGSPGGTPPLELNCNKFVGFGTGDPTNPTDFIGYQQRTDGYLYCVVRIGGSDVITPNRVNYAGIGNVQNSYEIVLNRDHYYWSTTQGVVVADFSAKNFDPPAFPLKLILSCTNTAAQSSSPVLSVSRVGVAQTNGPTILCFPTETALTTGGTNTPARWVESAKNIVFTVVVASIGTNVVVRYEGTLDNTNWFNLSSANTDTTITANGVCAANLSSLGLLAVRVKLVSISGASPTVTAQIRGVA
jgi:hypothetical protein